MIARRFTIAMVIAGLAVAGCGSSSKSSGTPTPTTASGAPKDRPKVTITAADFTFAMPAQIPAGYVDVTLVNAGKEDHQAQLVKLGSMTFAQFKAQDDITKVKAGTLFVGGPNEAAPGKSTTATVKLDPGPYAVVCFIPSPDGKPHVAKGMIGPVEVVRTVDSVETAPVATSTIVLGDFSFTLPKGFTGQGLVDVSNQGRQAHEMVIVKLVAGKTLADAKAFFLVPPGTPPPAGPPPFTTIPGLGGITGLTSQQHAWLNMSLTPGNYVLICFFPDPQKNNLPHALEGMTKQFTIS